MKKAKIMLSAIAVIAVLSGTLAFKAHYKGSPHNYWFCSTVANATTGTCKLGSELANADLSTTQLPSFVQFTTYATLSAPTITACTITTTGACNVPLYALNPGN